MDLMLTLLSGYGTRLPLIIVYIAGIALALTRRNLDSRTSTLIVVALSLLLGSLLVHTSLITFLLPFAADRGFPIRSIGLFFTILGLFSILITTVSFVLLLIAIFSRPREARQ